MGNQVSAFLNRISAVVPRHEVHAKFCSYTPTLIRDELRRRIFTRLIGKCQIERRYSVLAPDADPELLDQEGFYKLGRYPSTAPRMERFAQEALPLAERALQPLFERVPARDITHLILVSCTGFFAPGLDLELQRRFEMRPGLERTIVGFMGCQAAFNALKLASQIVRAGPEAKVLIVNLELCTLHLQDILDDDDPERLLGYLQFADGCAASLVTSEPFGLELQRFRTDVLPEQRELIQWRIGDQGFHMTLSTEVPLALGRALPSLLPEIVSRSDQRRNSLWAIHPGGRAILDTVQDKARLSDEELAPSRKILREFGNMSSATILFVLNEILRDPSRTGPGCAMAFGPGITIESMHFDKRPQ